MTCSKQIILHFDSHHSILITSCCMTMKRFTSVVFFLFWNIDMYININLAIIQHSGWPFLYLYYIFEREYLEISHRRDPILHKPSWKFVLKQLQGCLSIPTVGLIRVGALPLAVAGRIKCPVLMAFFLFFITLFSLPQIIFY